MARPLLAEDARPTMMVVRQLSMFLTAAAVSAGIAVHLLPGPGSGPGEVLSAASAAAAPRFETLVRGETLVGEKLDLRALDPGTQDPQSLATAPQPGQQDPENPGSPKSGSPEDGASPGISGAVNFDSDGDLLPDEVERVLMLDPHSSDTDGNGIDDFLHVVQFRRDSSTTPRVTDHEMRVVVSVSGTSGSKGGSLETVWVHLLFRFVGASVQDLTSFDPFLDHWGLRAPLFDLLTASDTRFETLNHPTEGLYVVLSVALAGPDELSRLSPCTLGATATLAGRRITTGSFLQTLSGELTTFVATELDHGVIQALTTTPVDDPFWTRDRVCLFRLSQVATAPGGILAEVDSADCIPARRPTACPPTCQSSVGRVLYFPDGMRTVTGGGSGN